MSNESPFAHRVARPPKPAESDDKPARPETIAPFAHTVSKKASAKFVLEPMPLSDDDLVCEEEIEDFAAIPLTDDDLGAEEDCAPVAAKPAAAATPVITAAPAAPASAAAAPAPAPVAARAPESSAMRQVLVGLVAFIATSLVLLLAVVAWRMVLGR